MLVTNKDKRSKKHDSKRDAARRIRHFTVEPVEPTIRNNPKRHNQNVCPLCGKGIEKTASGGKTQTFVHALWSLFEQRFHMCFVRYTPRLAG